MTETLLPQLETPEARRAVAEAVLALLQRWGLHEAKQAELLGVRDIAMVVEGGLPPGDDLMLERAGHLLAIGRILTRLYADEVAADWWVTSPCDAFGGFAPITLMVQGLDGIKRVRAYLEEVAATTRAR